MLTSATDLIGQGWSNYRRYWRHFLPYLILLTLTGIVVFLAGYIGIEIELRLKANRLINDLIIFLVYITSLVFSLWITTGIVQTAAAAWTGQTPLGWKETLTNNSRLIFPLIINSILVTLLIALGSILFVIPGIIFFVWYNFTSYAIILDNKNWKNSFSTSKSLVVGRWWKIAWRILVTIVVYAIISTIIQLIIMTVLGYAKGISTTTLGIVISSLASLFNIIITPALITSLVGLYINAKETPTVNTPPPTI